MVTIFSNNKNTHTCRHKHACVHAYTCKHTYIHIWYLFYIIVLTIALHINLIKHNHHHMTYVK
jgi:hypothetical protein